MPAFRSDADYLEWFGRLSAEDQANPDNLRPDISEENAPGSAKGKMLNYVFVRNARISNTSWLRYSEHSLADSNLSGAVMPFDSILTAVAWNNTEERAGAQILVYVNSELAFSGNETFTKWGLQSDPEGLMKVSQGDSVSVQARNIGVALDDTHATLTFEVVGSSRMVNGGGRRR